MYDYIRINNTWRSDSVPNLHFMGFKIPEFLSNSGKRMEFVPGELKGAEGKRQYKEMQIILEFAFVADSLQESYMALIALNNTFYNAKVLEISDIPGYFFRGHTSSVRKTEEVERWQRIEIVFMLNPPCFNKMLGNAAQMPTSPLPVCEQITENSASFSASITASVNIDIGDNYTYTPEIYMMLIGTWQSLQIGHLTLPTVENRAVYLDVDAKQVYIKEDNVRVNVPGTTGDFNVVNAEGKIVVKGAALNLQAHILAIGRY